MRMKKIIFALFAFLMVGQFVFAQNSSQNNTGSGDGFEIHASVLNGPTAIPSAWIMKQFENGKTVRIEGDNPVDVSMTFEKFASPQEFLPKLIKKEIDVGFLPVNVAAKAFSSGNKAIVCCAITGNTNLALITKDKSIKKIDDLSGKTVYVAGQGATPEYMFRWLLSQANMQDVTLDYSIPPAMLPAQLIAGKIDYAVVPEPFATIGVLKSRDVFYAIDLQASYARYSESDRMLPFTVVVARRDFAVQHKELLNLYLDYLRQAVEWTCKNPAKAGEYCAGFELGLAANVVEKAIPKSNYVYIDAQKGKDDMENLLKMFMSFDKSSVGSDLPSADFYYKK